MRRTDQIIRESRVGIGPFKMTSSEVLRVLQDTFRGFNVKLAIEALEFTREGRSYIGQRNIVLVDKDN